MRNYLCESLATVYQVLTAFSSTLRGDGPPSSSRGRGLAP